MAISPADFQQSQARVAEAVAILTARQWSALESLDDWPRVERRVTILTAAGQKAAAEQSLLYTSETLGVAPVVNTASFVGVAADGRPLHSLLYSSVVTARATYPSVADQLALGGKHLKMLVHTAVADAGRSAAHVQIAATPSAGYMRVVSPPCCQRCAVQAGRKFRWNDGFKRHPQCDCVHVPTLGDIPDGYTAAIAAADIKDLTIAQRQAIEDGADMNSVINARRGRSSDRLTTTEGTTRQGWTAYVRREVARQRDVLNGTADAARWTRRVGPRLTPEAIYREASNRAEAIRLLAHNGYITGGLERAARLATGLPD